MPHVNPFAIQANLTNFFVVTAVSNPARFQRRYQLYWRFKEMCEYAGVKLITVESQRDKRPFMVTTPNDPMNIQIPALDEFWEKENLLNIGIRRAVELGAKEVAWVDADVRPAMPPRDWFEETWQQLQIHKIVQMYECASPLDYNYNTTNPPRPSFMAHYTKHGTPTPQVLNPQGYPVTLWGGPGFAWAAQVDALMNVGGLIDFSIQGEADWQMANGFLGLMANSINDHIKLCAPSYARKLYHWQTLADRHIRRDVGMVRGLLLHDWHGASSDRGYNTRGQILADAYYNPDIDIKYGLDGRIRLEIWEDRQILMRDRLREYFRLRNEDAI